MSDHTKLALEQALQDHILDVTQGNLLTDWALIAASTQMDDIGSGVTSYFIEGNTGQPVHVSIGLLRYGSEHITFGAEDD